MDGGRVLRSLLAMRMEYVSATQIAASIGQGMAFVFGFIGLFRNPFLLFIAFFVYIGAQNEARSVRLRSALHGVPVSQAMLTNFRVLMPEDRLSTAIDLVLTGDQKHFPVVKSDQIVGVLTQEGLLAGLRSEGESATVASVMHSDFETADSYEMLETAFSRLTTCDCHTLPILHQGELVGLLTMDNVGEFIRIQNTIDRHRPVNQIKI
jgi:CBS-domain-containing membrane protein